MFVAVPIGHAGNTLATTPISLAQALLATRTETEQARARSVVINPHTDSAARCHRVGSISVMNDVEEKE